MIDSGNTLALAAKSLHENGAKTIYALISHGRSVSLDLCCMILREYYDRSVV